MSARDEPFDPSPTALPAAASRADASEATGHPITVPPPSASLPTGPLPLLRMRLHETDPEGPAIDAALAKLDQARWTVPEAELPVTDGHKRAGYTGEPVVPPAPNTFPRLERVIVIDNAPPNAETMKLAAAKKRPAGRKGRTVLVLAALALAGSVAVLFWGASRSDGSSPEVPATSPPAAVATAAGKGVEPSPAVVPVPSSAVPLSPSIATAQVLRSTPPAGTATAKPAAAPASASASEKPSASEKASALPAPAARPIKPVGPTDELPFEIPPDKRRTPVPSSPR